MDAGLVLQTINVALSGALIVYVIKVEHRFTKLETQMEIVLHRLRLAAEG